MQRRVRQQTATVAFWGGGNDKRPSSKNVLDTTMAWGDILTLLATELVMSFSPFISPVGNPPVRATAGSSAARQCPRQGCSAAMDGLSPLIVLISLAGEREDTDISLRHPLHRDNTGLGGRGISEGRLQIQAAQLPVWGAAEGYGTRLPVWSPHMGK